MRLVAGTNVLYAERLRVRANEVEENAPDVNIALVRGQQGAGITYMRGLRGLRRAIGRAHGLRPDEMAVPAMEWQGGE